MGGLCLLTDTLTYKQQTIKTSERLTSFLWSLYNQLNTVLCFYAVDLDKPCVYTQEISLKRINGDQYEKTLRNGTRNNLCVYQKLIVHLHPASVPIYIKRLSRPRIRHITGDYVRLPRGV